MGQIGRWIDEKCCFEPERMRRVLERRWGNLATFVDDDKRCGCMIGSYALDGASWFTRHMPGDLNQRIRATLADRDRRIGWRVFWLTLARGGNTIGVRRKRPDAFVIRLVKQRIRKALGIAPQREAVSFTLAQGAET